MFCNNCGKTIKTDVNVCPHCGVELGESRFEGNGYTSVQARFTPGDAKKEDAKYANYTRTTYTSMEDSDGDDVYARTTYRPVLSEEEAKAGEEAAEQAPESPKKDDEAAEPETPEMPGLAEVIEPLKPIVMEGINPEIEEKINRLKEKKGKPLMARLPLGKKSKPEKAEDDEDDEESAATDVETIDLTSVSDDEDEDEAPAAKGARSKGRILGMAAGALAIVLLVIGGFILITYLSREKSPIAGVSADLHEKGIQLIDTYTGEAYRTEMAAMISNEYLENDTSASGSSAKYKADQDAISALLPERPAENDQLFVDTLLAVKKQAEGAVATDAMELYLRKQGQYTETESMSTAEWLEVQNSVARLKVAVEAQELKGILDGAKVEAAQTVAPSPTVEASPTPNVYMTLKQGDKNSSAVKRLQQRLYALGYLAGTADGDFGAATQSAVKLFQQAVGLEANGIATPEVQTKLYAEDAPARNLTEAGGEQPTGEGGESPVPENSLAPAP